MVNITLEQVERLTGKQPKAAIVDRGYKRVKQVDKTEIIKPNRSNKKSSPYEKRKARKRFKRRAAIEPVIGHLIDYLPRFLPKNLLEFSF